MADVDASVTRASGALESECAGRVAQDRLFLQFSKVKRSSGVEVMGCEPLFLGPENMSCSCAWMAAALGQKASVKI
jgi:hypothetical protein